MEKGFEELTLSIEYVIMYRNKKGVRITMKRNMEKLNLFKTDRDELAESALVASVLFSVFENRDIFSIGD